ncbi:hypothetical protein [Ralstonia phage RSP15]|uniref:hypothetical protein n=1 Tax=Ralstonia phage RSP15 TaxID=1785960 RepID=UPI00074D42CD|nr:hypothetical protein BH754_gp095 [Ralstonia phage RSP15]BAU40053.1 hypothetical protein [Ralstonia phage RSP15]
MHDIGLERATQNRHTAENHADLVIEVTNYPKSYPSLKVTKDRFRFHLYEVMKIYQEFDGVF